MAAKQVDTKRSSFLQISILFIQRLLWICASIGNCYGHPECCPGLGFVEALPVHVPVGLSLISWYAELLLTFLLEGTDFHIEHTQ